MWLRYIFQFFLHSSIIFERSVFQKYESLFLITHICLLNSITYCVLLLNLKFFSEMHFGLDVFGICIFLQLGMLYNNAVDGVIYKLPSIWIYFISTANRNPNMAGKILMGKHFKFQSLKSTYFFTVTH